MVLAGVLVAGRRVLEVWFRGLECNEERCGCIRLSTGDVHEQVSHDATKLTVRGCMNGR